MIMVTGLCVPVCSVVRCSPSDRTKLNPSSTSYIEADISKASCVVQNPAPLLTFTYLEMSLLFLSLYSYSSAWNPVMPFCSECRVQHDAWLLSCHCCALLVVCYNSERWRQADNQLLPWLHL
jgi:hypothetical protein